MKSPHFLKRSLMKNYNSRTYSINDFVGWDRQKELELNPIFQRRPVWSDKAKSYLMDTILRGKPIPKIFIRQKVNVSTKTTVREVVDGQQRLRSILSFIKDGFVISRQQNREYGGIHFSQLDEDVQAQVLSYEISVDLLINLPDAEVLDIFSRLNSYAIILNEQEKLNANHFGPFKVLADEIGRKYLEYWKNQKILSANNILRMAEVSLVADLLIAMSEGIKSKKQVKKYYDQYEEQFDCDVDTVMANFDEVMNTIGLIYPEGISETEFTRPFLFYTLFTTVAHCIHGLPGMNGRRSPLTKISARETARNKLDRIGELFLTNDISLLKREEQQFMQDSRRATTDEQVRVRRTKFLLDLIQ